MLPRLLCERLCSLNPSVDRLSYSVFFRMDIRNGELVDYKHIIPTTKIGAKSNFESEDPLNQADHKTKTSPIRIERTIIRSCAKWNY